MNPKVNDYERLRDIEEDIKGKSMINHLTKIISTYMKYRYIDFL